MTTKESLRDFVKGLTAAEKVTLRAIINGSLSKREITPEQQAKMQRGRKNV